MIKRETGNDTRYLHTDGGGEFIAGELKEWLAEEGIKPEKSAPETPEQNGIAERFNRTTAEHALAILLEAEQSKGFWPEAHLYASDARNASPTSSLDGKIPDQLYYGKKPDVAKFHIFGSKCHVRASPAKRRKLGKLAPHSHNGIFMGFAENYSAYKIWLPDSHRWTRSRNVKVYKDLHSKLNPVITEPHDADTPAGSEGVTKENVTPNIAPASSDPPQPATQPEIQTLIDPVPTV